MDERYVVLALTRKEALGLHNWLAEVDYLEGLPDGPAKIKARLRKLLAGETVPNWFGKLRFAAPEVGEREA